MSGNRLENNVAVVTGGGSGIGRAICLRFAAEGAAVAILDIAEEKASETAEQVTKEGGICRVYSCDVTQQQTVLDSFDMAAGDLGTISIVVNNAGISHVGNIENAPEEDVDRLIAVNVKGVYNGLLAAVRHMKKEGGAILNLASTASSLGIPERFAYSLTKGAVATMTFSVAVDYIKDNIRCNCVAPARVHTPFVDDFIATNYPGREQEMFKVLSRSQPIGRMGLPEEVADAAIFLCSGESRFITGVSLPIDGGTTILRP
jgi:2-keto-3-deoxy-L-fuconate dehydrogenase